MASSEKVQNKKMYSTPIFNNKVIHQNRLRNRTPGAGCMWRHASLLPPALGRQKQADPKFETSLVHIVRQTTEKLKGLKK